MPWPTVEKSFAALASSSFVPTPSAPETCDRRATDPKSVAKGFGNGSGLPLATVPSEMVCAISMHVWVQLYISCAMCASVHVCMCVHM